MFVDIEVLFCLVYGVVGLLKAEVNVDLILEVFYLILYLWFYSFLRGNSAKIFARQNRVTSLTDLRISYSLFSF